jgi:hypothetical protein
MNICYFIPSINGFDIHILPFLKESKGNHIVFYMDGNKADFQYNNVKFVNILECLNFPVLFMKAKADAFILFNFFSIMDIFFIQLCKVLRIKIFYIQHGLRINYQTTDGAKIFLKRGSVSYIFNTAIKKYSKFFYLYVKLFSDFKDKKDILGYGLQFIKNFLYPVKMTIPIKGYKKLSVCDYAFVYSAYDQNYLIQHFNYDKKKIEIIGLPLKKNVRNNNQRRKILLITNNLRNDGLVSQNNEKVIFNKLFDRFKKENDFVIKLHPLENEKVINTYFRNSQKPLVLKNVDPGQLIVDSDLVICFFSSTLLLNAVKYNKPILFINLPNVDFDFQDSFGFISMGIGKCMAVKELTNLNNTDKIFYIDQNKYKKFVKKYIGPDNSNYPKNVISFIYEKTFLN